jgi:hypothetical protein
MCNKTIGLAINNPLNIRYNSANNWLGQRGHHRGFCVFHSRALCYRAAVIIIRNYQRHERANHRKLTIERLIHRWAPITENNTDAYVRNVCRWTKLPPDHPVSVADKANLTSILAAMARQEVGIVEDPKYITLGYDMARASEKRQ